MSTTTFSAVSAVKQSSDNVFDIEINSQWTAGGWPNGGYLLAMIGRAACAIATPLHILVASAHYFRPPEPGPASVEVEPLHSGRASGSVRGRLTQNGKTCVEALFTLGDLAADPTISWQDGLPEVPPSDPATRVRVPPVSPTGLAVPIMDEIVIHLDGDTAPLNGPSGRGELRGWLSLPDDEPFDPISLIFAVDALPPATFDVAPTPYVPTVSLTTYVRALPAPGPVRVLVRAHLLADNRSDQTCHVWDSAGRLVAQATQLSNIRLS